MISIHALPVQNRSRIEQTAESDRADERASHPPQHLHLAQHQPQCIPLHLSIRLSLDEVPETFDNKKTMSRK
ncbi:hypothetical protein H1R20_g4783, partial [Candolleomyces eurysporus]